VRWGLVEVDAAGARDFTDVLDLASQQMKVLRDSSEGRVLATRVRIVGASHAHGTLSRNRERLENELRAFAVDQGDIYLERVQCCTVGRIAAEVIAQRRDALGELFSSIEAIQGDEEATRKLWEGLLRPLSGVSADLLKDESVRPSDILLEARRLLEGRLLGAADEGEL